jgi:chitinase
MKKLSTAFALLFLFLFTEFSKAQSPCKEIIGYYPNWQWYDRSQLVKPTTIAYSNYSIINYCFFKPEASGLISNTDAWADENLLQGQINWSTTPSSYYPNTSVIDLAHNAGTKVMVSIGGWTLSDNFPGIAANAAYRATFAHECNRLLQFYNFDGIDIDWEYPGYTAHSGTTADTHNFTLLLQQIRDSITVLGATTGKTYKLSACFSADPARAADIEWSNVSTILDMVNLMTYDFFGAWDCLANHNSPLYAPTSGDPTFNINSAFNMLVSTYSVPASKINLGIAFYGRSQTGATALHATTSCNANTTTFSADDGSPMYYNVDANMPLFDKYWDNTAKVPYLLGKSSGSAAGTFVSYDNALSVGYKAQYIKDNNARGAIIWEITGDYIETSPGSGVIAGTPLADTLNQVFCSMTTEVASTHENEMSLTVYPNPANGTIHVILKNNPEAELILFDIKGSRLLSHAIKSGENEINLQSFAKGIYFIKVSSEKEIHYQKIVLE